MQDWFENEKIGSASDIYSVLILGQLQNQPQRNAFQLLPLQYPNITISISCFSFTMFGHWWICVRVGFCHVLPHWMLRVQIIANLFSHKCFLCSISIIEMFCRIEVLFFCLFRSISCTHVLTFFDRMNWAALYWYGLFDFITKTIIIIMKRIKKYNKRRAKPQIKCVECIRVRVFFLLLFALIIIS